MFQKTGLRKDLSFLRWWNFIKDLDNKADANYGWLEEMNDMEHLTLHIKGIPHDY